MGFLDALGLNGPVPSPKGNWKMVAEHLSGFLCQPKQAARFATCLTPHFFYLLVRTIIKKHSPVGKYVLGGISAADSVIVRSSIMFPFQGTSEGEQRESCTN